MDEVKVIWDAFHCGIDAWMDIWGDPLLSGTIFMVSYGVTALLIFRAAGNFVERERWYWRLCGSIFLFQAANTSLDLHALVWTTGRCLAHAQGWYENRGEVLLPVLIVVALLVGLILFTALIWFFGSILNNLLLTAGVSIALCFTVFKGINEQFDGGATASFGVADLIELCGIALALLAILIRRRRTMLE